MKFVLIFGPQAVGKMTVGQELEKLTGFRLFHNHMTIEFVSPFFSYSTPAGKRLVHAFRQHMFEEVAKSDLPGFIFTYVWGFDLPEDWEYVSQVSELFASHGAEVYYVELEASLAERLRRNRTPNRLEHKATKRDLAFSEQNLLSTLEKHRLNSEEGELDHQLSNYLRINNDALDAAEVARRIKAHFQW